MKKYLLFLIAFQVCLAYAQEDSTVKPKISYSVYLETYYGYDFGNPNNHLRPGFIYSHNRHNEFNLNLGLVKAAYEHERVRANLGLMAGTYSNANLAAEPGVLKNIYEANVGVKLSKKHELWLDAGIMSSHIGFESAIGKDCWTLTRSILADNSPYYESGAKISWITRNEKWLLSGLVLNGWQKIHRPDDFNTPAFGHQLVFKPSSKVSFNSSSFIGSDTPDSIRKMRYFHNFYGQFQVHKKFGLIVGFDCGVQQKSKHAESYNFWYSPVLIARYAAAKNINLALRGEYYSDKNQVMITTETPNGFQVVGCSLNLDYAVAENVLWRIEGKGYFANDNVFVRNDQPVNMNVAIYTALAISF